MMLSQFLPTALDRLVSFAQLYEECGVDPSLSVFTIWYHIMLMNTDQKRVQISSHAGLPLITHFSIRTHH